MKEALKVAATVAVISAGFIVTIGALVRLRRGQPVFLIHDQARTAGLQMSN